MALVNIIQKSILQGLNGALLTLFSQRDRWALWLPVPFSIGIYAYFARLSEPDVWMVIVALPIILLGLWIRRGSYMGLGLLLAALVAAGFAAGQWRTHSLQTVMLSRESGPVVIEAAVQEVDALPRGLRLTLQDTRLITGWTYRDEPLPNVVRLRMKAKDTTEPRAGDIIQVRAVLLPLSGPVMPGAFDFQRHAYFNGLGATGYAIGDVKVVTPLEKGGDIFETMRHAIRKSIATHVTEPETAAVITAFLIGETKAISEASWDVIRRSGIAHLLAISGFHITVVTGAFFFLVRAILALWPYAALHWPIKKISAAIAMAGSIFYLLLIGSPITAERAVIMACVVMIAIILDRDPFSLRLAAFAALLLLALQPEALIGPSFQMSFAAVVALIAFYESTARRWLVPQQQSTLLRKAKVYLVACLLTTIIATIATGPYTLYHFGQVPVLAGLVANMVAVPLSSLVSLPFGILGCLLISFGLEAWPFIVAAWSMEIIMDLARVVAAWPHAVVRLNSFPAVWLGVITLGGLWVCIWRGRLRWLGILPVLIGAMGAIDAPRAVVLAADNGRLLAVRDAEGGLWLSSLRREKFVAEAWLAREVATEDSRAAGDFEAAQEAGILNCDSQACLFKTENGRVVSLVKTPEAVRLDCEKADVFISAEDRLNKALCPAKRRSMIDTYDLRYGGAHAIYADIGGGLRIEKVATTRGNRPWVPSPPRRRNIAAPQAE